MIYLILKLFIGRFLKSYLLFMTIPNLRNQKLTMNIMSYFNFLVFDNDIICKYQNHMLSNTRILLIDESIFFYMNHNLVFLKILSIYYLVKYDSLDIY